MCGFAWRWINFQRSNYESENMGKTQWNNLWKSHLNIPTDASHSLNRTDTLRCEIQFLKKTYIWHMRQYKAKNDLVMKCICSQIFSINVNICSILNWKNTLNNSAADPTSYLGITQTWNLPNDHEGETLLILAFSLAMRACHGRMRNALWEDMGSCLDSDRVLSSPGELRYLKTFLLQTGTLR